MKPFNLYNSFTSILKSFAAFLKSLQDTYTFPRALDIELIMYIWILSNKEGVDQEFLSYKRLEDEIEQTLFLKESLLRFDLSKFQDKGFKKEIRQKLQAKSLRVDSSADRVEGPKVFAEKRKPVWLG